MTVEDVSRLLIVLAIASWVITGVMYRFERSLNEAALTERTAASVIVSVVMTGFAAIGGSVIGLITLPRGATLWILIGIAVLIFATQVIWATGLLLGKFR